MKRLMAISAVGILLFGLIYMVFSNPHIPLLDANRSLLAETEEQGYCAGIVYAQSGGYGDPAAMTECQAEEDLGTETNHALVLPAFCKGLWRVLGFPEASCAKIVADNQYWPTLTGEITNSWNKTFPYPLRGLDSVGPADRGNDRDANDRTDIPVTPEGTPEETTTTTPSEGEATTTIPEEETT